MPLPRANISLQEVSPLVWDDLAQKLGLAGTLAVPSSPAENSTPLIESTLLRKAGEISPFRACLFSANLSRSTSNETVSTTTTPNHTYV